MSNILAKDGKLIGIPATPINVSAKADKTNLSTISATGSTNNTGSTIKAGTYFYLDGVLKRAKTDISNGASFTTSNMESGDNVLNNEPTRILHKGTYSSIGLLGYANSENNGLSITLYPTQVLLGADVTSVTINGTPTISLTKYDGTIVTPSGVSASVSNGVLSITFTTSTSIGVRVLYRCLFAGSITLS